MKRLPHLNNGCTRRLVKSLELMEILLDKITDPLDPKIRKMLRGRLYGNEISTLCSGHLAHDLPAIDI